MLETKEWKDEVNRVDYKGNPWPRGVWDNEPDRKQWEDKETGLPCLIVRNEMGNLCGYVGVPQGHPYFEKNYDDIMRPIDVHGGLTYSNHCHGRICHIVSGEDKVWWLGFDCGHCDDLSPGLNFHLGGSSYRDMDYVTNECTELARQLKKYA